MNFQATQDLPLQQSPPPSHILTIPPQTKSIRSKRTRGERLVSQLNSPLTPSMARWTSTRNHQPSSQKFPRKPNPNKRRTDPNMKTVVTVHKPTKKPKTVGRKSWKWNYYWPVGHLVWYASGSFAVVARSTFRGDQTNAQPISAVLKMAKTKEKRNDNIIKEVRT
jgi:hypothetical protein